MGRGTRGRRGGTAGDGDVGRRGRVGRVGGVRFLDTEAIVVCGGLSARAELVGGGGETGCRQEGVHWKESVFDQSGLSRR